MVAGNFGELRQLFALRWMRKRRAIRLLFCVSEKDRQSGKDLEEGGRWGYVDDGDSTPFAATS